jgi:hypothetical protein
MGEHGANREEDMPMPLRPALLALALLILAACSGREIDPVTGLERCDDGGDGGVIIDGVCL